jgi:cell wall-associated NlpC family hydrolase
MTGFEYVTQARDYIGVPFRHAGRNRNGVDCVGLVLCAAYDLKLTTFQTPPYSRQVDSEAMRRGLMACGREVSPQELEPGDVLFLKVLGTPTHLAVYTGATIIHAYEPSGSVCEVRFGEYWLSKVEAAFRWQGLD